MFDRNSVSQQFVGAKSCLAHPIMASVRAGVKFNYVASVSTQDISQKTLFVLYTRIGDGVMNAPLSGTFKLRSIETLP